MMERNGSIAMNLGSSGGSGSETGESSSQYSDSGSLRKHTREGLKREFMAEEESEILINAMAKRFKSVDVKSDADSASSK